MVLDGADSPSLQGCDRRTLRAVRDELNEPLGLASGAATVSPAGGWRAGGRAAPRCRSSCGLGRSCHARAAGLAARRRAVRGGENRSRAKLRPRPRQPNVAARARDAEAPPIASAGQVEAASGVKVTRAGGGSPPNARIIDVERALAVRLDPAPDPRLIETSRSGPLPRVGADGARPFEVYARPVAARSEIESRRAADRADGRRPRPQRRGHRSAIAKLPGAVTLGFAPYGAAIEERAAEAREAGHETALQAPMEDFSDRTGDPGPHTLKTSASDGDNLDSLRWLMSRFTGYVAVVNHLGGKFTADSKEISPVLDGNRSAGPRLSRRRRVRRAASRRTSPRRWRCRPRAPTWSSTPTPRRRRSTRRWRGSSIAPASEARRSASPPLRRSSVERLARWANGLESKGVALVPLSALMSAAPGRSAQSKP